MRCFTFDVGMPIYPTSSAILYRFLVGRVNTSYHNAIQAQVKKNPVNTS
jgi:hypothetical protein